MKRDLQRSGQRRGFTAMGNAQKVAAAAAQLHKLAGRGEGRDGRGVVLNRLVRVLVGLQRQVVVAGLALAAVDVPRSGEVGKALAPSAPGW